MNHAYISFSAVIATSKSAEMSVAEMREEEGTARKDRCTRETGSARHAEPLSPNFLSNRMNHDSENFSAAIVTGKSEECKRRYLKKTAPARGCFFKGKFGIKDILKDIKFIKMSVRISLIYRGIFLIHVAGVFYYFTTKKWSKNY